MTTPVIITLIICGTLIALSALGTISDIIKRKNDNKNSFLNIFRQNNENK